MASSHLLHNQSLFFSSPFKNCGFSNPPPTKVHFQRTQFVKASKKQLEIVYDPDERLNKLAGEVDKEAPFSRLTLFSPCKTVSLGDMIKFSLSPSKTNDRLSTNVSGVPLDDRNLIIKALNLYRKKTDSSNFFWVHLDKKVPTGAGLGGGSSNAATALWAANQFNGCVAAEKELQEWSSEIGSDIPFFFSHGAAYCTGRGEIVQDISPPLPLDIPMVLIKPKEACPTAEVYKRLWLDQTSNVDPLTLLDKISMNGISQDVCINDLVEAPSSESVPRIPHNSYMTTMITVICELYRPGKERVVQRTCFDDGIGTLGSIGNLLSDSTVRMELFLLGRLVPPVLYDFTEMGRMMKGCQDDRSMPLLSILGWKRRFRSMLIKPVWEIRVGRRC
ncbi:4-diphosphocytidyl-2-C-methyl-D-erythritol kinase [Hibiscus syriacus]|uniref:4-diphosphocytidyl-2-C-methyl-D-erythritol kinase n=1 Tax=Hibiscus syriacus TaxID=106335 RepID=A0A6A3CUY7_HIBSY|nr:4-diphosphocytidyl-2-C-methyl-D-erythritol kinase [Hibiscus syriacus]